MVETFTRETAWNSRYFESLNLHRNEVDGSDKAEKLVKKRFLFAMKYVHTDAGGQKEDAIRINNAKRTLLDEESRINYIDALETYNSNDGLTVDPDWEAKLQAGDKAGLMKGGDLLDANAKYSFMAVLDN